MLQNEHSIASATMQGSHSILKVKLREFSMTMLGNAI